MIINKCNNLSADQGIPPKNWTSHITYITRYAHDAAYRPIGRVIPPFTEKILQSSLKKICFLFTNTFFNVNSGREIELSYIFLIGCYLNPRSGLSGLSPK